MRGDRQLNGGVSCPLPPGGEPAPYHRGGALRKVERSLSPEGSSSTEIFRLVALDQGADHRALVRRRFRIGQPIFNGRNERIRVHGFDLQAGRGKQLRQLAQRKRDRKSVV